MMTDMRWTLKANCKGRTQYFFPPYSERPQAEKRRIEKAKKICSECSVTAECREYGRKNGEVGVWGGETDEERHISGFMTNDPMVKKRLRKRVLRSRHKTG